MQAITYIRSLQLENCIRDADVYCIYCSSKMQFKVLKVHLQRCTEFGDAHTRYEIKSLGPFEVAPDFVIDISVPRIQCASIHDCQRFSRRGCTNNECSWCCQVITFTSSYTYNLRIYIYIYIHITGVQGPF